jgi:hypothetical protein
MLDSVPDFGLGETIRGKNDDGVEINLSLDGREYTFPITEEVASAAGFEARTVGRRITARIMRNKSGAALNKCRIIAVDVANGYGGLGHATGEAAANTRYALVVDPSLSGTVADGDLFYAIVKGPAKVQQKAAAATLIAGSPIKCAASGRVDLAVAGTDGGRILGTCLKANNTNDAFVEVDLAPDAV